MHVLLCFQNGGCIIVKSQLYAHRSIPSLLVQELDINNPAVSFTDLDWFTKRGQGIS